MRKRPLLMILAIMLLPLIAYSALLYNRVQTPSCWSEDAAASAGSWAASCDNPFPSTVLFYDDGLYETHLVGKDKTASYWGGLRVSSSNISVVGCDAISSVRLCYKWWSATASIGSCDISVDANGGSSYSIVTNACPGTTEPASMTCIDITSLEPWECSHFFGSGATGAMAKSEALYTGGPREFHDITWDVLYFNVTYTDNAPAWSNNKTSIVGVYSQEQPSYFNITWQDSSQVHTVFFESNISLSKANYTMINITPAIYNFSSILPAGTFYWKSHANDSIGQWNSSDAWIFTIQKADPVLELDADPAWTITYGTQTSISCTADTAQAIPNIYRNDTLVSNPDMDALAAGIYNYTCNNTLVQNYTTAIASKLLNITKASGVVHLYINGSRNNRSILNDTYVNISATLAAGLGNITVSVNETKIYNGTSPSENITLFNQTGLFNVTVIYEGNQNYTAGEETWWINVSATPPPDNPPTWSGNSTSILPAYSEDILSQFNITWMDDIDVDKVFFESNHSGIPRNYSMDEIALNVYNFSMVLPAGTFYWKSYANDSAGNWSNSSTWFFTIEKGAPQLYLLADPSFSETYGTQTNITCLSSSSQVFPQLYVNDTLVAGLSDIGTLDASTYNYTCNVSETFNYTSNQLSQNLVIGKAPGAVYLYLAGLQANYTAENNTYVNIRAQLINGTKNITVYHNSTILHNGTSPYDSLIHFNQLGWHNITTYYSGDNNYYPDEETFWVKVITEMPISKTIRINQCWAEDADSAAGTWGAVCDNAYPGPALYYDDGQYEVHRVRRQGGTNFWAGLRINASNSSIMDCDAIESVSLCRKWWSATPNIASCDLSVDTSQGVSYSLASNACPGTSEPSGISCVEVTWLEPWSCDVFFGPYPTGAMAKSELVNTNTANGYWDITWDAFYFNVSYINDDYPYWSNNRTNIVSVYSPITPSLFNITWQDDHSVDTVYLESNHTGSRINYTLFELVDGIYNYSGILPAGSFYWKSHANDSIGQWNMTPLWLFTIEKADPGLMLEAIPTWTETYGTETNVTCYSQTQEVNYNLYRNDTFIAGRSNKEILAGGQYNYTCNSTATQNYTQSEVYSILTIQKAEGIILLSINGTQINWTMLLHQQLNLSSRLMSGDGNIQVYNNHTLIHDGPSPSENLWTFNNAGMHNISAIYPGNRNYTGDIYTLWVNVTIDEAPPIVNIDASLNNTMTDDTRPQVSFNFTDRWSHTANCSLYLDDILYNRTDHVINNTQTVLTPDTLLADANYTVYVNCTDESDNTGMSGVIYMLIDTTAPIVLDVTPDGSSYNLTDHVNITANVTDAAQVDKVLANISWPGANSVIELFDTDHDSIFDAIFLNTISIGRYNVTIYANDTFGHVNDTEDTWFMVNDVTVPSVTLSLPGPDAFTSQNTVTFTYTPDDDHDLKNCSLFIDHHMNITNHTIDPGIENIFTQTFFDGVYNWSVNCSDSSGNTFMPEARVIKINYNRFNMTLFNETFSPGQDTIIRIFNSSGQMIYQGGSMAGIFIRYNRLYDIEITSNVSQGFVNVTIFSLNMTSDTMIRSMLVNSTSLPENMTYTTPVFALNDTNLQYNHSTLVLPRSDEVNVIMHCLDWNYSDANCTTWETSDADYYGMQENATHIFFNVTSFDAFGGGGGATLANITNITVYDVTDSVDTHSDGSLVSFGLNRTFYLNDMSIYRVEFTVVNLGNQWTILPEDILHHDGLNSTWRISISDIWYSKDGVTNYTGGTWGSGKLEWNRSHAVKLNKNEFMKLYYVVNITTNETETYAVNFLANDTSRNSGSYDNSGFSIQLKDRNAPVVNINLSQNNSLIDDPTPSVSYNFTDLNSEFANCSLYFDGLVQANNPSAENGTMQALAVSSTLADANYSVYINCTDNLDNTGMSDIIYIAIDTSPPRVLDIVPLPDSGFYLYQDVTVKANVTDSVQVHTVLANITWQGGYAIQQMTDDDQDDIYETIFSNTDTLGRYNITIIANDSLGHTNATEGSWFLISPNVSIVIGVKSPANKSGDADLDVVFSYNVTSNYAVQNCSLVIDGEVKQTSYDIALDNIFSDTLPIGLYFWRINCSDPYAWNTTPDYQLTVLRATEFDLMTDFSKVDMSSIDNLYFADNDAKINYSVAVNLVQGHDIDAAIELMHNHVSVDPALGELDEPARLSFYGLDYQYWPIALKDEEPCQDCVPIDYSGNAFTVDVQGFSAYSTAPNSMLAIFDDSDKDDIYQYSSIGFYANYTSRLSGLPVEDALCSITLASTEGMLYDGGIYAYEILSTEYGLQTYDVTCSADGYETLSAMDYYLVIKDSGYIRDGNCTLEYIDQGRDSKEGVVGRGEQVRIYCESPIGIKGGEEVSIIVIPKNGAAVKKLIYTPDVLTKDYETLFS